MALGCFDGIHIGHQCVINTAVCASKKSCVFSFADDIPFKNHAKHIITFKDKCSLLEKIGVDELVIPSFDSICSLSPRVFFEDILMKKLDAQTVVCGENYRFGKNAEGDVDMLGQLCNEHGVELRVIPPVSIGGSQVSSSRIRSDLIEGNVAAAQKLLGRPFSYDFEVVSGRKLGRQLGTPTINQYFPENFIIPKYGVYASVSKVNGVYHPSVTNIGVKPTVGSERPLSETWILDFSGDLYGQRIRVCLIEFMRGEIKFDSIDELKKSIIRDGELSRALTQGQTGEGQFNGF